VTTGFPEQARDVAYGGHGCRRATEVDLEVRSFVGFRRNETGNYGMPICSLVDYLNPVRGTTRSTSIASTSRVLPAAV
jgi:hypothetical protein